MSWRHVALGEGCRVQDILVHPAPLKSSHTNNNNNNNNEEFGGGVDNSENTRTTGVKPEDLLENQRETVAWLNWKWAI